MKCRVCGSQMRVAGVMPMTNQVKTKNITIYVCPRCDHEEIEYPDVIRPDVEVKK